MLFIITFCIAGSVEGSESNNNAPIIWGVIGGGIALVLVVALMILFYCLYKNGRKDNYDIHRGKL